MSLMRLAVSAPSLSCTYVYLEKLVDRLVAFWLKSQPGAFYKEEALNPGVHCGTELLKPQHNLWNRITKLQCAPQIIKSCPAAEAQNPEWSRTIVKQQPSNLHPLRHQPPKEEEQMV